MKGSSSTDSTTGWRLLDQQTGRIAEHRTDQVEGSGALGKAGEHVEFGKMRGGVLQFEQGLAEHVEERVVKIFLARERSRVR